MVSERSSKQQHNKPLMRWIVLLIFLAATAWGTRYWLSAEFGLYEDDLTFIPAAIESDFSGVMRMISGYFSSLAEQGRPLMWSWVVFFSHIGWSLGRLQGMYVLAYLIWLTNIILFVFLLKRLHKSFFFSVVGGLAYVLFSADTNQAFLFNVYGLQTAITFLLIALHIYLSKNKVQWLAYLFLLGVLVTYETPYWLFIAAPMLTALKGKKLRQRLFVNTLVMTGLFLIIYLARLFVGESRVAGLGFPEILLIPIKHMVIGPFVGLGTYFLRPLLVVRNISPVLGLIMGISFVAILALLYWAFPDQKKVLSSLWPPKNFRWARLTTGVRREFRLAFAGIIMLVFAYPLTIILRPYAISGRETRVHMAAVVGAALIFASLTILMFRVLRTKGLRIVLFVLISLVLGFNFTFGFIIQKSYQRAWDLQQNFWRELIPLVSDVNDGTAVLVEPTGLEDTLYINANTWVLPRMLERLYVFPKDWDEPARVFRLVEAWETNIIRVPGHFTLDGTNSFAHLVAFGDYKQDETIFIATQSGDLERLFELTIMDEAVSLKPLGEDVLSNLDTRVLYDLMILSE